MKSRIAGAIAFAGIATAPLVAHHSFSAEFDIDKPVKMSGTISEMKWSNPHAWIYVDVKEADGTVVKWAFETQAANALYRRGWRREDVVPGTVVTVEGWRARNGTPTANTSSIVLPDGRKFFAGSPATPVEPR